MGIQVKFDGNYKPLSIKGDNSADYWNVKYQLGENPESVFPQAEPQQGENGELESVEFSAVNLYGREALRNSKDISQTRVPKSEVERIQRELESLHALAENPNVPEERRNFYRNLRLPDPSQIPFAWRISGLFRKHLHILWGFGTSRNGDGTFLPKTTKSEKSPTNPEENWPDNHLRYSIKDILSPANGSSRLSSWSFTPLAYFLLLLLIIGLLFIGWRYGIPLMNNLLAGPATDTTTSQEQKKTLNPKPGEKDGNSDSKNNISNDPQAGEKGGSSGTKENIINDPQAGEKGGNSGTKDNITNDPQAGEKDGNSGTKDNITNDPQAGEKGGNSGTKDNITNDPKAGEKGGSSDTKDNITNDPHAGEKDGNSGTKDNITNDPKAGEKDGSSGTKDNITNDPQAGEKGGNSGTKDNITNNPKAGEKDGNSGTKDNITNDPHTGEKDGNSGTKDNITNDPQAGEKDGNSDSKKNLPSNTTPRKNAPAIADYTFSIQLGQVTKQGDIAAALFNVVPDKSMGNQKFIVHSWSVNGKQMLAGDNKSFSCKRLSYKERYVITASVTVNGKAQKVLPYQWNNIDTPVWMIIRAGNNDNEYQVLCTNSSSVRFSVEKWKKPVFYDGRKRNISDRFRCSDPHPRGNNKAVFRWSQDHIGEYLMSLEATVCVTPADGKNTRKVNVENTFVFINGSMSQALISLKLANMKERVYHCLATNIDGSQHNGTAFAISQKYLLTNYHVAIGNIPEYYGGKVVKVDSSRPLILSNEHTTFYAKVVRSNKKSDLALLKLCDRSGGETDAVLPAFFLVSDRPPEKGARVLSIGYPAGTTRFGEPAFSDGKIEDTGNIPQRWGNIIAHFSNIRPGYSGGPLVYMDRDSVVIGVNTGGVVSQNPLFRGMRIAVDVSEIHKSFPEYTGK